MCNDEPQDRWFVFSWRCTPEVRRRSRRDSREFWAHGRKCAHSPCRSWQCLIRNLPNPWFILSTCQLDWGWYPDGRLTVTPSFFKKAHHTRDVNWGPWPETMSSGFKSGRPACLSKSVSATWRAVGRPEREIKQHENLSITTRMVVKPSEGGRSVTVRG
jgi:hypothetical protein